MESCNQDSEILREKLISAVRQNWKKKKTKKKCHNVQDTSSETNKKKRKKPSDGPENEPEKKRARNEFEKNRVYNLSDHFDSHYTPIDILEEFPAVEESDDSSSSVRSFDLEVRSRCSSWSGSKVNYSGLDEAEDDDTCDPDFSIPKTEPLIFTDKDFLVDYIDSVDEIEALQLTRKNKNKKLLPEMGAQFRDDFQFINESKSGNEFVEHSNIPKEMCHHPRKKKSKKTQSKNESRSGNDFLEHSDIPKEFCHRPRLQKNCKEIVARAKKLLAMSEESSNRINANPMTMESDLLSKNFELKEEEEDPQFLLSSVFRKPTIDELRYPFLARTLNWLWSKDFPLPKVQFLVVESCFLTQIGLMDLVRHPELSLKPFSEAEDAILLQRFQTMTMENQLSPEQCWKLVRYCKKKAESDKKEKHFTLALMAYMGRPLLHRRMLSTIYSRFLELFLVNAKNQVIFIGVDGIEINESKLKRMLDFLQGRGGLKKIKSCILEFDAKYEISARQLKRLFSLYTVVKKDSNPHFVELDKYRAMMFFFMETTNTDLQDIMLSGDTQRKFNYLRLSIELNDKRENIYARSSKTLFPILKRYFSGEVFKMPGSHVPSKVLKYLEKQIDSYNSTSDIDVDVLHKKFPSESLDFLNDMLANIDGEQGENFKEKIFRAEEQQKNLRKKLAVENQKSIFAYKIIQEYQKALQMWQIN